MMMIQVPLIASQDIGDDKIQIVQALTDVIENKTRQLDHDSQNLDFGRGEEEEKVTTKTSKEDKGEKGGKRPRKKEGENGGKEDEGSGGAAANKTPVNKKHKKAATATGPQQGEKKGGKIPKKGGNNKKPPEKEKDRSDSPPDLTNVEIDPDEPTYCLCDQVHIYTIILPEIFYK